MAKQTRVDEPDLMDDVRSALADPEPLSLLALVSTLLCVTDIRRDHPLAPPGPEPRTPPREELARVYAPMLQHAISGDLGPTLTRAQQRQP